MSQKIIMAGEAMFGSLKNLPCGCLTNIPYAGGQVEQVVTKQCARCRSMAAWILATGDRSATQRRPLDEELARLLTEALDELFEVTRDSNRQRSESAAVHASIKDRANALVTGRALAS